MMSPPEPVMDAAPPGGDAAGRGARLAAVVFDSVLLLISTLPLGVVGITDTFSLGSGALYGVATVAIFVVQIVFLTRDGQTLGKKVVGIRIVKVDTGENGGFVTNVLLRTVVNWLLGAVPLYPLVDALFIFRDDRRCIHDHIAGTRVVYADGTR